MVHLNKGGRVVIVGAVLLVASLTFSACGALGGGSTQEQEITVGGGATFQGQAAEPTPTGPSSAKPNPSGTPGAAANIDVSPGEVTLGNVTLTLWIEPAQPAYDPARVASSSTDNPDRKDAAQPKGYAVLGGSTLKVTNNFDPAQNPPADQQREIVRHVALQVKEQQSGQLIPHINVNMDLLREGRSVLQDQPLVPMAQAGGSVAQMHYGNNVKFPGKGEYQIFVRMEPSPLLGSGSVGVAQFNVSIK